MKGISAKQFFHIIKKTFAISLKTKSKMSIFISLLGLIMAFSAALESIVLRDFTDQIQSMAEGSDTRLGYTFTLFGALIAIFLISEVYSFFNAWASINDNMRIGRYIKETIIKSSCDVEYKYIDNYDGYKEKISFAGTYAGRRVAESIQSVLTWFKLIITFVSIVLLLGAVDYWIVIILLLACVPATVLAYLQKDEAYMHNTKWITEGDLVIHYFFVCADELAMAEVRSLRLLDFLKARWRSYADSYLKKKNRLTRKHVLFNSVADFLRNAVYIGVLLIAAYNIYRNPAMGLGTFMLVFTLSGKFQKTTTQLFISIAQFFSDVSYMKDFLEITEIPPESFDPEATPCENSDIEFKNVNFTYPGSEVPVLRDISVNIRKGEKIAIVGENGSGKTTFVNLLCGMYYPDCGEIKIGDRNIFDNLTAVRRSISAVFQDFGKYEDTIRNNITVSDRSNPADDEKILSIAKDIDFYDCIAAQPDGLNEELGTFSKHSNNLSGGQWQKLALCRAMYRDSAKIMVLDEPTAALDPIAEATLYKNFSKLTKDKTTILISHRLGITQLVDRVLVFRGGMIVEDGTHAELLKQNGYYSELYNAQAKWYQ